jgi:hypothetical protein
MAGADYSTILSTKFPTIQWEGSGSSYNNIKFTGQTIPQADLDNLAASVERELVINKAIKESEVAYYKSLNEDFVSSALGQQHKYSASNEFYLILLTAVNLAGYSTSTSSFPIMCCAINSTTKSLITHSPHQIRQVLEDRQNNILNLTTILESKIAQINSMSTVDIITTYLAT